MKRGLKSGTEDDGSTADFGRLLRLRRRGQSYLCVLFFQAEDGIRDLTVTGVQTCALPISFQKRYRVAWLIPNFDPAVPTYSLCAGADTIRTAYHGYGSLGDLAPPRDSLSCLEWTWLGRARVTCSGSVERAVVTRGRWVAGEASGWYRIISVVEQRRPHDPPHVFVPWVAPARTAPPDTRVAMVELPPGKGLYRANVAVEARAGPL